MAEPELTVNSSSPQETFRLGQAIGELAGPGDVILLSGPLGAGKTCMAQGIARGMGVIESPPSPSYVLVREFSGRLPLYHMDLYRLEFEEIEELGLEDYLFGKGVCIIEWAEKAASLMPKEHLAIRLSYAGDSERKIVFAAAGNRYGIMSTRIPATLGSIPKDDS